MATAKSKPKRSNKPISEKQTKSQILTAVAEQSGVSKKDAVAVTDALADIVRRSLIKGGVGEITIPAVALKLRSVMKPATKARKGTNPFTGQEIMIKAKPARIDIRARPMKALKDAVAGKK
ncbi:MAG: HU family DNA-binding protein [Gammaproteobacteria bacterium]|nr:HU family DNA-binding protein [Gammaproteobacteria bacterium]